MNRMSYDVIHSQRESWGEEGESRTRNRMREKVVLCCLFRTAADECPTSDRGAKGRSDVMLSRTEGREVVGEEEKKEEREVALKGRGTFRANHFPFLDHFDTFPLPTSSSLSFLVKFSDKRLRLVLSLSFIRSIVTRQPRSTRSPFPFISLKFPSHNQKSSFLD